MVTSFVALGAALLKIRQCRVQLRTTRERLYGKQKFSLLNSILDLGYFHNPGDTRNVLLYSIKIIVCCEKGSLDAVMIAI